MIQDGLLLVGWTCDHFFSILLLMYTASLVAIGRMLGLVGARLNVVIHKLSSMFSEGQNSPSAMIDLFLSCVMIKMSSIRCGAFRPNCLIIGSCGCAS